MANIIWKDRKRIISGLPRSLTCDSFTFGQRIRGLGAVHLFGGSIHPGVDIKSIKNPLNCIRGIYDRVG